MSKLDPKSLKCNFFGYFRVQKGYKCYCPSHRRYLVSIGVTFLENVYFSQDPIHTSQWEDDNLLVYTLASLTPLTKPPITQVYTRHQHPQSRALHQLLRHQIQFLVMISLLFSVKVNVSVLTQFPPFALMTTCHHILVHLSHPWTLFRCLTLFLKPSLTLVAVVL